MTDIDVQIKGLVKAAEGTRVLQQVDLHEPTLIGLTPAAWAT